jgi:hypothetical protein
MLNALSLGHAALPDRRRGYYWDEEGVICILRTYFCIQSTDIGLSELSLLLSPFLDVGLWAYSTIHGLRRLFTKARAGLGASYPRRSAAITTLAAIA